MHSFLNRFIYWFFSRYINYILKKDFKKFSFNKEKIYSNQSILLLANHYSWWDGFCIFQINRLYFKKKFHVLILEENYHKVWFLKYMGALPIKRNSKSMLSTLNDVGKLLNTPNNLILFFPQGKLYSNHISQVVFEKGMEKIVQSSNKNFQYLFAASFIDYLSYRKPSLNYYFKTYLATTFSDIKGVETAYNQHYESSLKKQTSIIV